LAYLLEYCESAEMTYTRVKGRVLVVTRPLHGPGRAWPGKKLSNKTCRVGPPIFGPPTCTSVVLKCTMTHSYMAFILNFWM